MPRILLPILILTLSLPCLKAAGQEDAADVVDAGPVDDYFDVVDVEIANIDVWVTDRDGEPVDGLGKDDFLVFRDGRPVEVANFYAVSDGRPATPAPAPVPAAPAEDSGELDLPPPVATGLPEIAPEHQLWMILYIDNYNIEAIERNRIFPALRQFLGRALRPGDHAMLVTYNRSLEVRQPFTDSIHLLDDALDELVDDAGLAVIRNRERFDTLKRIDKADDPSQAMVYARNYAEEQMNGVQYTVEALERLIDTLAGLPGRKALIHVSSGVPMAAGEEMFHAVAETFQITQPYSEIPRHDTTRDFERVNRHANSHRVSFYTVDAGGLRGLQFGAAEYGGFVNMKLRSVLDSVVPENLQAPLRFMALETGGRAIVNVNEILPPLTKAAQDFRSFYSLGIASVAADTGRYHQVEVKLRDGLKGLQVRHRAGYRSKTTDTRVRENLRSALLYSQETAPGKVQVTWGRARPHEGGNYLLPIRLHVPLEDVVLLPIGGERHEARLRLYVAAVGEDGATSEIDSAPLGIRLADEHVEAARKEALVHTHQLLLSPGRKRVGIAVLDLFGRESSTVVRSVLIGPQPVDDAG